MSGLLLINKATSFLLHSNVGGYNKSTAGEVVKDRPAQRDRIRADVLKRMKAKPDETTVEWGHQPWKRKELLAEYKQPSRPARVTCNGVHGAPKTADEPIGRQCFFHEPDELQLSEAPFLVSLSNDPQIAEVHITNITTGLDGEETTIRVPTQVNRASFEEDDENYEASLRVARSSASEMRQVRPVPTDAEMQGQQQEKLADSILPDGIDKKFVDSAARTPAEPAVPRHEDAVEDYECEMNDEFYRGPGKEPLITGIPEEQLDRIFKDKVWHAEGDIAIYKFMTSWEITIWLAYPTAGDSAAANEWLGFRCEA